VEFESFGGLESIKQALYELVILYLQKLYYQQDFVGCSIYFKNQGTLASLSNGSYSNESDRNRKNEDKI
jgi:hypothetical protein